MTTNSRSTDKLELITQMINQMPKDKLAKLKTFSIDWEQVGYIDPIYAPKVKIEVFP